MDRTALLDHLAAAVLALRPGAPALVAIDGRSAAGKSTLANELAERVQAAGRPALRASLDDFHPPGHKHRSAARGYTPESFRAEGYDYAAFQRCLLDPLRPGGDRRVRLGCWDSYRDAPIPEQWVAVPDNAVLLVDGAFLLGPDVRDRWDYRIWVEIDWQTMVARGADRDSVWAGPREAIAERYRSFWIPTHEGYERATTPRRFADVIVDNRNPDAPVLVLDHDAPT
ncbi:MAG TPA: hypothetical protein VFS21_20495 [Roseiflexaceae bacterium]|nr:hypothetical protein [Roseiflexaceae bacterium]